MGRTIGVIEAQMASERLPGRIIAPLGGRPLLAQLWARIADARIDEWWLATSWDPMDDVTEAWGFELGLRVFRGERGDSLTAFLGIGGEARADWVLRVPAENPFVDARLIQATLDARDADETAKRADLIQLGGATTDVSRPDEAEPRGIGLPLGYAVELIRFSALQRAAARIPLESSRDRQRVTSWLARDARGAARVYRSPAPASWPSRPDWRWTVDSYEDLAMARSAFRLFGREASAIDYPAMVAQLDAHPEIAALNRHIERDTPEEG